MSEKMNLVTAGYHMLHILCAIDNEFKFEEDLVIRKYLVDSFPFSTNLDNDMEIISNLGLHEYKSHFAKCMDDFYSDSTVDERNKFIDLVMKLVMADQKVTREENELLDLLFNAWEESVE